METSAVNKLFRSAAGMEQACNYNDWTFSLFEKYIKGNVLEVGCGVGEYTRRIAESRKFGFLLSIDISGDAVSYCRHKVMNPAVEVRRAGVLEIEGSFDCIICMNVMEHVREDGEMARKLIELLRPGGILFLLVPSHGFLFTPFDSAGGHLRRYSKKRMRELLFRSAEGHHLRLEQFYFNPVGALGYFLVYKICRKLPQSKADSEIGFFDRWMVPVLRRMECGRTPLGISLVSIARRED